MNFTAKNENDEVGYTLVANGSKTVTRRIFKRKCPKCKKPMDILGSDTFPYGKPVPCVIGRCDKCNVTRKIISVGDLLAVCPGQGKGPAVCVCGHLYSEHRNVYDKEADSLDSRCSHSLLGGGCDCQIYRSLKVRVVSIQRHTEWEKEIEQKNVFGENGGEDQERLCKARQEEAQREGFATVGFWLAYYPEHNEKISSTWRVEFQRVRA